MLTSRPAESVDDLRTAADLMSHAWQSGSRLVAATPAAVEWWYVVSAEPLRDHLRLWEANGTPVAWSWLEDGELEWHVWTGDVAVDVTVLRAILEAALDADAGRAIGTWSAEDDGATIALLRELGFRPEGRRLSQWQWHATDPLPAVSPVPDGYRIRGVNGPDEFEARVALHRRAFPASQLTVAKYERVTEVDHYRFEDDLVVEAADDSLAAYALGWWDPVGRVAEFEPVGTHPDHRRQGLARALLSHGLHRFFERGATTVQVYSDASAAPAEALYEALGLRRRAFHQRHERPATTPPAVRSTP